MRRLLCAVLLLAGCSKPKPELHVFTWADYFAEDTIANFEQETGCTVVLQYMDSSESLRAMLSKERSGYDVVFPSDEVMADFIRGGLIQKLDLPRIPNLKHVDPAFWAPDFDPGGAWSAPYMWGTTGIAYNRKHVDPPPDSWAALWDARYDGRVTILDDAREALAAAMHLTGGDPMKPTAEAIAKAERKLAEARPLAFDSQPLRRLIKGEAWISQAYSGDALQAAQSDERTDDIGYVIPKEGGSIWVDSLCIARGAPQPELAHRFIDYLLRPEVSAAISNAVGYANPNAAARPLIDAEIRDNPIANPPEAALKRSLRLGPLPPDLRALQGEAWARLKAR